MAKLYFKYGVMGSGKSLELLQINYDYQTKDGNTILMKPLLDTKGGDYITSRLGVRARVDYFIKLGEDSGKKLEEFINNLEFTPSIILVDEAQFLDRASVLGLYKMTQVYDIPVICFGLRTTYDLKGFEGSNELFAIADSIEEISTRALCEISNQALATKHIRYRDGEQDTDGEEVVIDDNEKITYKSVSSKVYYDEVVSKWI